jgi:SAM-dependent methyltransferase
LSISHHFRETRLNISRRAFHTLLVLLACLVAVTSSAVLAQTDQKPFEPIVGQSGRDVVWVPTPFVLVEKMLDMAGVTPQDYVVDLGSGDGRNVIAAAKRGARALGVEFNPNMVDLSKRIAAKEGVADKATFVEGDMYEADFSEATVLALFLLTENLNKLAPKFLDLRPGTRIVANGFGIDGWTADETGRADGDCGSWCTAYLYIVPARVAGTWRLPQGELTLEQKFQAFSGRLSSGGTSTPIANGRLRGDQIRFTVGSTNYEGRVTGETIQGSDGKWSATRLRP